MVLGGSGFLGSHLCHHFVGLGWKVRAYDRSCRSRHGYLPVGAEAIQGDFSDAPRVEESLSGIDIVFHALGSVDLKAADDDPEADLMAHVPPVISLTRAAARRKVKQIVFLSSGGTVYGIPDSTPILERHPTNPISAMGVRNLTIEKVLQLGQRLYGVRTSILRVSNAYGERQKSDGRQGAVAAFIRRLRAGETLPIWGNGSVVRDYVYAGDVARAAALAAEHEGVFNIGSGQGLSIMQVIDRISRALGRAPRIQHLPERPCDVPVNVLDISAARERLGWAPSVTFDEGIARTLR